MNRLLIAITAKPPIGTTTLYQTTTHYALRPTHYHSISCLLILQPQLRLPSTSPCLCKRTDQLVGTTLSRLGELSVGRQSHVLSELQQHRLHGVASLPVVQAGQIGGDNNAALLVDAGDVNLGNELDHRGLVGVISSTLQSERVDAVLVCRVGRAQNGAVPESHFDIVGIGETQRTGLGSDSFFAVIELL